MCSISHGNRFDVSLAANAQVVEIVGGMDRLVTIFTQELEELESLALNLHNKSQDCAATCDKIT